MIIEVNDQNFDTEVIERSKKIPVLVDFWAEWCAPCLILKPILEKLAEEFEGRFVLAKANVNEAHEKATEYGVMSIPAVKLFKNGEVVDEFVGAAPEEAVRKWLEERV